jgi:hypothetical protein
MNGAGAKAPRIVGGVIHACSTKRASVPNRWIKIDGRGIHQDDLPSSTKCLQAQEQERCRARRRFLKSDNRKPDQGGIRRIASSAGRTRKQNGKRCLIKRWRTRFLLAMRHRPCRIPAKTPFPSGRGPDWTAHKGAKKSPSNDTGPTICIKVTGARTNNLKN